MKKKIISLHFFEIYDFFYKIWCITNQKHYWLTSFVALLMTIVMSHCSKKKQEFIISDAITTYGSITLASTVFLYCAKM
jgi:hypothetical protein